MSSRAFFDLVATLREAVSDPVAWREPATTLYQHLISPIEEHLEDAECLEIDASGILGRIPMGILTDGRACLAQRTSIKYVMNIDRPVSNPDLRHGAVHCAAFQTGPLATAPSISHDACEALEPYSLALGQSFTRDATLALLQTKPAYLTIATHFEIETAQPDLSTLLLGDDTLLYMSDLAGDQFDLNGIEIALFATCSSGVDDDTGPRNTSLAALALEKGVDHFVGTLWDISEAAAAEFIDAFWQAFYADPTQDPAKILSMLQSRRAQQAQAEAGHTNRTGGIGSTPDISPPEDWAAFAIFENCNKTQLSM
jgi:CHAT domain-containing protein